MREELKNRISGLQEKIVSIGTALNIDEKRVKLSQLQKEAENPALWSDPSKAKKTLQDMKLCENQIGDWEKLTNSSQDLLDLIDLSDESDQKSLGDISAEIDQLSNKVEQLEFTTWFSGPYDLNNAILSINSGAGGTDAQDWAQILLRMYTRWAQSKNFEADLPEISYGEEAGIKSATIFVRGPYAYGFLKTESGVHRLVRMSPFNSDGKRHTSFASVDVIPEVSDDIKIEINPSDLKVDTYRASGPGGQNVNKVSSAIRITHLPTGIVAQSQSSRSQHDNREYAMKIIVARLYERLLAEHKEKIDELRGERKEIGWGNQIRSYVFQPYTLVKDHRTNIETGNVQKVLDGEIDLFRGKLQ